MDQLDAISSCSFGKVSENCAFKHRLDTKSRTMRSILSPLLMLLCAAFCATAQSPARKGTDYAVLFYVTTFQPGWQPLPATKAETEALKKELETNYGFTCELVANPTKQQIYDKIGAWNQRIGPNDQVLFFFSAHGHFDKASKLGYLIAADGQFRDEYFSSWLDYNSLRPYFARCKAKNILVALDACHSGSFGNIEKGAPDGPDYNKELDCQTQIDRAFQYQSRLYVCSGNENDRTPGDSRFAAKFLETLRKGAPNPGGVIHYDDLHYALGKVQNPEPVHGDFTGHDPGGDFVFVKKNACNTTPPPDRDSDGIPDATDQCPDTWGSQANGCPPDIKPNDTANDLAAWKTAKQQHTEAAYREYLRQFPGGEFKDSANTALRKLEADASARRDDTAWEIATEKDTPEAYKRYLADYPNGLHRSEAETKMNAASLLGGEATPDNMVLIPSGTFQMGSTDGESDEKPAHSVTVSSFYLGKHEVTVTEFKAFIDATGYKTDADKAGNSYVYTDTWKEQSGVNWKYDTRGNLRPSSDYNHPVVHVSWNDAVEYCKWMSKKTGKTYRLPTEAEWEYAAGGGASNRTKWAGVSDENRLNRYANTNGNQDGYATTAPVGSLQPNALGLHDMSGNVWEWCSDWYDSDYYKNSPSSNPTGPSSGSYRVLRGGSWNDYPQNCRVANRSYNSPGNRSSGIGFRLARTF
jgi:sulfatase modifying factor 1